MWCIVEKIGIFLFVKKNIWEDIIFYIFDMENEGDIL